MARAQNIPVPIIGTMNAYNNELSKKKGGSEPEQDIFAENLLQWRLMIFALRVSTVFFLCFRCKNHNR